LIDAKIKRGIIKIMKTHVVIEAFEGKAGAIRTFEYSPEGRAEARAHFEKLCKEYGVDVEPDEDGIEDGDCSVILTESDDAAPSEPSPE
jgi:hypothetical protein